MLERRLLGIAWTLPDALRCEIVRAERDGWEVVVRDGDRDIRSRLVTTLADVGVLVDAWRREFTGERGQVDSRAAPRIIGGTRPASARRRRSVLLVDSPRDDRTMYAEFLRHAGFEVREASDPVEALAQVTHVDAVIVEPHLPGDVDGFDLVRQIRSNAAFRDIAVLVLTSWVWTDDRDRAEQAGCDAFLPKPCLPEKLTSELRRLLLTRRLSRPAAAKAHGERRSPHRPYHGQHAICPGCGSTLIFCDRFVLLLADESHGPGWLCENADCAYRAAVRRPEPTATGDRHRRPRALIAGSDEARRTRFRAALHALHWQTQETIDGRDALAKALADNPDVLVVDERLAGLDALSLCELVKRDENARSIRLLLVADTPSARARLRAKEIGIDELVTSSVSSKLLRATFLQMIAGAAPGRPKRSPSPAKAGRLARPSKAKRVKSS